MASLATSAGKKPSPAQKGTQRQLSAKPVPRVPLLTELCRAGAPVPSPWARGVLLSVGFGVEGPRPQRSLLLGSGLAHRQQEVLMGGEEACLQARQDGSPQE